MFKKNDRVIHHKYGRRSELATVVKLITSHRRVGNRVVEDKWVSVISDDGVGVLCKPSALQPVDEAGEIEIIEIDKEEREEIDSLVKAGKIDVIEIDPDCDDCAYYTEAFETPTRCTECQSWLDWQASPASEHC